MPTGFRPTALFAVDQSILPSLLENLAHVGIRVPRHLSVVVADVEARTMGLPGASQATVRLTTVRLDLAVFVRRVHDAAAQLAVESRGSSVSWREHLAGREPFLVTTPAILVPADSTAPPPGA
jgi:DNA-binding LacI/PurR family transcriptional regulator